MSRLFTIILLTLIDVLELLLLLGLGINPTALVLVSVALFLVFFMLLAIDKPGFWGMGITVVIIHILNTGYLYLMFGRSLTLYAATFLGFLTLIVGLQSASKKHEYKEPVALRPKRKEIEKEIQGLHIEPPKIIVEYPEKKVEKKVTVKKKNNRRRYVASTKGKAYHTTRCEWVDNIKEKNKIRFSSRKKAEELGYKPHDCIGIKKKYTPGKFLASKNGKSYHIPKCPWAKKIKKKNRVWFKTKRKAENQGYEKHICL